jgi:hypothetical protein
MTGTIDPARFGMPDATTAGVQAGVTLTAYKGPMTITTPGTVIENVIIDGTITVAADNVTFKNCVIRNFDNWGILSDNADNTRVEYCDIDGSGSTRTSGLGIGGGTNSAIIGCDISGMVIGVQLFGRAEVKDNFIHDLADTSSNPDDRHFDGITLFGGQNGSVIEHNTISMPTGSGGTAAVFIKTEFGAIDNVQVRNNLMTGDPSFTVYVESTTRPITNVTVENNYVEKGIYGYFNVANSTPIIRNNVQWNNNTDPTPYPTSTPNPPSTPTPPSVPTIASFSNDSGVANDKVTNDSTLTLTGSAAAGSTVKVLDGGNQIGTATANASGSWTYTTAALSEGNHSLTATATTSAGTSAASAALAVRIDTTAPNAPTIATPANSANGSLNLTGTAEANSVVKVFDGATEIGTATANGSGVWGYTTGTLAAGSHSLTAKATDAAGNTGAASAVVTASTGTGTTPPPTTPAAPTIASFSNDSGVAGDRITNDSTLTLTGTAAANSTVKVFDGNTQLGTATANGSGVWSYTTAAMTDGNHSLTAKVTNSYGSTSTSPALAVTIDTTAPTAPKIGLSTSDATARTASAAVVSDDVTLTGTAEANSTVKVFDGTNQIGTTKADASGTWNYTAGGLADGSHSITSKAVDAAGNTSASSAAVNVNVNADTQAPTAEFTNVWQKWNDKVVFKGTADPYSQITIYDNDGTKAVGTVKAGGDGTWSVTTSSAVSDSVVHRFTATVTDSSGHTSPGSGSAVMGTHGDNRLMGTSGDDLFRGNGGHDTFNFAANFGNDVITDFGAGRRSSDVVQFSKSVFDDFADVMAHAAQSGQHVVIDAGAGNSLTLKNTSLSSLDKGDFHFV